MEVVAFHKGGYLHYPVDVVRSFGANLRQGIPDDCSVSTEGICLDLNPMALQPLGKFLSHVI